MFTPKNRRELEKNGYTVIENVLDADFCDKCVDEYTLWTDRFQEKGSWPFSVNSLIQRYKIGHFETSWKIRLGVRHIFSKFWGTEKLLTSFDAIAIGRPPETSEEEFHTPNHHWLHTDQSARQLGLHTVQGAVYLESCDKDDWTFVVLEKSHQFHKEFMDSHHKANLRSSLNFIYRLRDGEVEWFEKRGCVFKRIPVGKGGLVLWDSRLMHANSRPIQGRQHPNRYRRVVFVCMGPAIWANKDDLREKKKAYRNAFMTTHFPCQNIAAMPENIPSYCMDIPAVEKLPKIAKSPEAKLLAGETTYDFNDGFPNGPAWTPEWRGGYNIKYEENNTENIFRFWWLVLGVAILLGLLWTFNLNWLS